MHWFKRNPIFFSILILLAIVFVVEVFLLLRERSNVEEVRQTMDAKISEYDRLRTYSPSLVRENLELAEEDLVQVEENLASVRAALGAEADVADLFVSVPSDTTEAFFDLTSFVDDYRRRAANATGEDGPGVRISDDEYFGFSRYRNSGPPSELIEDVYKQRQIMGHLLDTLFSAGPEELIRARRGDVAARRDVSVPSGSRDDVFTIAPEISARIPGFVETYPFQFTFVGYTSTLRAFLNRLAEFEMPILVRSVEVTRAEGGDRAGERRERRTAATQTEGNGAVPIVEAHRSRFVVTVEFIELASPDDAAGTGAQTAN